MKLVNQDKVPKDYKEFQIYHDVLKEVFGKENVVFDILGSAERERLTFEIEMPHIKVFLSTTVPKPEKWGEQFMSKEDFLKAMLKYKKAKEKKYDETKT